MNLRRAVTGFLLSVAFLIFFMYATSSAQMFFQTAGISAIADVTAPETAPENKIEIPEINAESAISVESNLLGARKIIFEKNSGTRLPIASLTKLMSAIVVLDNYDLSKNITVDKFADAQAPMKQDVKLGDIMPAESFLKIMLVGSSNKSAFALAEQIGEQKFVALMNQKAKDFGMASTFFSDPTGLSSNNVSTANDLAKLAEYILKNYPKIADISKVEELDVPGFGKITNTDQLLAEVPEAVCSKTGFTTEAKGCLLLVINNQKNNDYSINVILGADDRFSEMKKLISTCN